jgi:hypothetical protein
MITPEISVTEGDLEVFSGKGNDKSTLARAHERTDSIVSMFSSIR